MAAYVGFKNLIIGAGLMLFLKGVGALAFLHRLPELKWLY
jgi:NosR/NirI family nitrous oxide reductase transcriptional regulator